MTAARPGRRVERGDTVKWRRSGLLGLAVAAFLSCPGNNVPDAPAAPEGPAAGYPDSTHTFSVATADPDGDSVAYRFSWGDGDTTAWSDLVPSESAFALTHVWDSVGSYAVTAEARDSRDAASGWSAEHAITISERPNHPPDTPLPPAGPPEGYIDSVYTYWALAVTEPDGDSVAFRMSWGDGDTTEWSQYFGPNGQTSWQHSWSPVGVYALRVQSMDKLGAESVWSDSLLVTIRPDFPRRILATIPVRGTPKRVAVLPGGERVYVTTLDGTVEVIDASCDSVVATVSVGGWPDGLAMLPSGDSLYVADLAAHRVLVLRTADNVVVDTIALDDGATGAVSLPTGEYVYVALRWPNKVAVIRTSDDSVVASIEVGMSPYALAATADCKRVYVTNENSANVSVIRTEDNTVEATVPVGEVPYGIVSLPNSEYVYVANSNSDNVMIIRTADNKVAGWVDVKGYPLGLAVTPGGEYVYVSREIDDAVTVIRTEDNTPVCAIDVPGGPTHLCVSPDGRRVYVVSRGGGHLAVIGF